MSAAVRLEAIGKRFPVRRSWWRTLASPRSAEHRPALEGVDLSVGKGEFFGLLGPNGAGKSTLFRILSTLVRPDEGRASVGGIDVVEEPQRVRRLVSPVLPNERSLYWRISARENLRLFAALHGVRSGEARRRIAELLEILGLEEAGEKQVGLFSSGMRQRLLVARALVGRPRLLLLDEPTRSLDPEAARRLRAFLRKDVGERMGCTVLLATHDRDEVSELCDRIGVLHRGRLVACGDRDEVVRVLGGPRFRLRTSTPGHPALRGVVDNGRPSDRTDRWTDLELELSGGEEEAARLLGELTAEGVVVSRFERVRPSLAELIERAAEAGGEAPHRPGPGEARS